MSNVRQLSDTYTGKVRGSDYEGKVWKGTGLRKGCAGQSRRGQVSNLRQLSDTYTGKVRGSDYEGKVWKGTSLWKG